MRGKGCVKQSPRRERKHSRIPYFFRSPSILATLCDKAARVLTFQHSQKFPVDLDDISRTCEPPRSIDHNTLGGLHPLNRQCIRTLSRPLIIEMPTIHNLATSPTPMID